MMTEKATKTGEVKINREFVLSVLASRDMTLRDLAAQTDIGEATLYRITNGAAFKSDTLGRLAQALGCSPVDLLDVREYAPPLMVAPPATVHKHSSGRG